MWVVSACGAVPSGAVAAGEADGEALWVARTTHRCRALPGALRPSRHCCVLYADGAVHHYTKYQVRGRLLQGGQAHRTHFPDMCSLSKCTLI